MTENNRDAISKFKALDSEGKFKIVELIAKEGENSITDVRNKLKLSFSTAHKYLNELEKADILKSDVKIDNGRQKKLYVLKNFKINFDVLSSVSKQDSIGDSSFHIVNAEGLPEEFKTSQLRQKLMDIGIPVWLVESVLSKISNEVYGGISISSLESLILRILLEEKKIFDSSVEKLSSTRIFGDYSLQNIMKEKKLESSIKMYNEGGIDIYNIGIPKPVSILHDLRPILKNGLSEQQPPKNLYDVLNYLRTILEMSKKDIAGPQAFNHLNVFLAPFISGLNVIQLKEMMENLANIYTHISSTMQGTALYYCFDLAIPSSLQKQPAIGPKGKVVGTYGDFESESQSITKAFLEAIEKLKQPRLVFNMYKGWDKTEATESIEKNLDKLTRPLFANLVPSWQKDASYFHEVIRIDNPISDNSFGKGNCQTTTINLPRIAWQTKGESEFFESLDKSIGACLDVLTASAEYIGGKSHTSPSFIFSKFGGERYYDLDKSTYVVCTAGLNEVAKKLVGYQLHENEESVDFTLKVLNHMKKSVEHEKMPFKVGVCEHIFKPVLERFAQKDIHDFGDKVIYSGDKENPCYTSGSSVAENSGIDLKEKIRIEKKFHALHDFGHQSIIKKDRELGEILKLVSKSDIGYFVLT
ncbi:MAG: winged helix-turn-helix transcriptional regulator [Candidatus Aenigmarchaeota archaeon]|nr:winged helix-turn-helix transcriptional regulator [Candidatus Aenigmarchaeota archaeon]